MNQYINNGENFLKNCVFEGLAHSYDVDKKEYVKPYPEVTGYVIKYFCEYADGKNLGQIKEAAKYLCEIQHSKGGYKTFYDKRYLYSFDTAQILNGLISFARITNDDRVKKTVDKAGEFLLFMIREDGAIYPVYDTYFHRRVMPKNMYPLWNGNTSGLLCKLTEVYDEMYKFTEDARYLDAVKKVTSFYINVKPLVHTHPLGYWLEGLYAGGEKEFVKEFLINNVVGRIQENGFIPYAPELEYSYTSGQAQLAILMYNSGLIDEALKIRGFVRKVQANHNSGGIFQFTNSDGTLNRTVHSEINSWGTKYYCELERLTEKYE